MIGVVDSGARSASKRLTGPNRSSSSDAIARAASTPADVRTKPVRFRNRRPLVDRNERRASPAPRVVPHWDADLQELRVNGLIVKQFKVPAPNQEMVLAAFQEEGWPTRIDDPLPPQAEQDPKRRLHDTIVSLNRTHKHRLIRFMGDGSGEGVRWTIVTESAE